jgi:hypothetical protein
MVFNLTRPVTATRLPEVKTRREKARKAAYGDSERYYGGLSKNELLSEIKKMRRELKPDTKKKKNVEKHLERLDAIIDSMHDLYPWASGFLVFEKPVSGATQSLRAALSKQKVASFHEAMVDTKLPDFSEVFDDAEIFRIEHDWFKAIQKADEFETGSFRLPYETSVFEFQIAHRPVVVICTEYASDATNNEIIMQFAVEAVNGWMLSPDIYRHDGFRWEILQSGQSIKDDKFKRLVELVGNQIRAACIALDAEVATTTLVRQAHEGHEREAKEHPDYEFYTINIASRDRAESLQSHNETKGKKRLHFRRGHWRHYESFKTWVRWCLVGNPELGFIDKQYRL